MVVLCDKLFANELSAQSGDSHGLGAIGYSVRFGLYLFASGWRPHPSDAHSAAFGRGHCFVRLSDIGRSGRKAGPPYRLLDATWTAF